MPQPRVTGPVSLMVAVLWLVTSLQVIAAQSSLKVIDNPGGGQVVYGAVDQDTAPAAMAAVLHYVHTHFGEAPAVGKVFQSRDGQNFGAFFTVTAKTQGNKRIAGLAIVSVARGTKPAAAVLYDESSRFAKTEPVLLRALTDAWRSASAPAAPSASAPSGSGSVPPLTPTRFPDGSGAVSLPAGWRITFSSHGAAKIVGPRGEAVLLGNSVGPIYDANNPQVLARMRYANPNNRPMLCPNSDALHTYLCILQQGGAQPAFQLKNSRPLPPQGRAVQSVLIDADLEDEELIASKPRHRVRFLNGRPEAAGDCLQDLIAGCVSEAVVNVFESIQVDHEGCNRAPGIQSQSVFCNFVHPKPIGHTRQAVVFGEIQGLGSGITQLEHLAIDAISGDAAGEQN